MSICTENPFKVLGVKDNASLEECTASYKKLAKKYHPDLNPNDYIALEAMKKINTAYDEIKNNTVFDYDYHCQQGTKTPSHEEQTNNVNYQYHHTKSGTYFYEQEKREQPNSKSNTDKFKKKFFFT